MRRMVYKKYLEHLNTTKFLVFISITVVNLFILLVVMFYVTVGNSDQHEDLPCEGTLSYVVYNKPQIEDFSEWNNNCDWMLIIVNSRNKNSPMYSKELINFAGVDFDSRIVADLNDVISSILTIFLPAPTTSSSFVFNPLTVIFPIPLFILKL